MYIDDPNYPYIVADYDNRRLIKFWSDEQYVVPFDIDLKKEIKYSSKKILEDRSGAYFDIRELPSDLDIVYGV